MRTHKTYTRIDHAKKYLKASENKKHAKDIF